jgi:hypothetical protein
MVVAESGAQRAQAAVADDEGSQCFVRAFDQMDLSCVTEPAGTAGSVVEQRRYGLGQGVRGGVWSRVTAQLVQGPPAVESVQEGGGGESPDPVGVLLCEAVQEERVSRGRPVQGGDVKVRRDGDLAGWRGRGR